MVRAFIGRAIGLRRMHIGTVLAFPFTLLGMLAANVNFAWGVEIAVVMLYPIMLGLPGRAAAEVSHAFDRALTRPHLHALAEEWLEQNRVAAPQHAYMA